MVDLAADGEVIGGSTSVNVMDSARAHRRDWDHSMSNYAEQHRDSMRFSSCAARLLEYCPLS
jgi:hypothetical protein